MCARCIRGKRHDEVCVKHVFIQCSAVQCNGVQGKAICLQVSYCVQFMASLAVPRKIQRPESASHSINVYSITQSGGLLQLYHL